MASKSKPKIELFWSLNFNLRWVERFRKIFFWSVIELGLKTYGTKRTLIDRIKAKEKEISNVVVNMDQVELKIGQEAVTVDTPELNNENEIEKATDIEMRLLGLYEDEHLRLSLDNTLEFEDVIINSDSEKRRIEENEASGPVYFCRSKKSRAR